MQALLKLTNFVSKTFRIMGRFVFVSSSPFLFPAQFKIFAPYIPYF